MSQLQGKVAVILGASSKGGIGEAIARRFAHEGARVVVAARRVEPLQALADDIDGLAFRCDLSDESELEDLIKATEASYGPINIAVNAAGHDAFGPIAKIKGDQLDDMLNIHFKGPVLFIKQMANAMKDGGSVINLSSITALKPAGGMAAYGGAKAGVDHVVRIAALEYAARKVRINSLAPGLTRTPMTEGLFETPLIKLFDKEIPLGRTPTVADVAGTAVWLAGDDCFETGMCVPVAGGMSLMRLPTAQEMAGSS